MSDKKFDPKKLQKLNNPKRLEDIPPGCIQAALTHPNPSTLVDIGAGTAFFSIALLRQFKASRVYACDVSGVMLDWIRDNVTPDYPAVVPVQTTEHTVPLGDGIADLVFMINLHHELESPSRVVDEAARLLKPGGQVVVVDWKKEEMPEGPPREIRCEPGQVREQLLNAGFTRVTAHGDLKKHFMVVGTKEIRHP
jgi:SAM-dependent methyltransferase